MGCLRFDMPRNELTSIFKIKKITLVLKNVRCCEYDRWVVETQVGKLRDM